MKRHVTRALVLIVSHLLLLVDCYILGLPLGLVMIDEVFRKGHWGQIGVYGLSLALILRSFIVFRREGLRDLLYLAGMIGLIVHWIILGQTAAYEFRLRHLGGILVGGTPFVATVVVQLSGIMRRLYSRLTSASRLSATRGSPQPKA